MARGRTANRLLAGSKRCVWKPVLISTTEIYILEPSLDVSNNAKCKAKASDARGGHTVR